MDNADLEEKNYADLVKHSEKLGEKADKPLHLGEE